MTAKEPNNKNWMWGIGGLVIGLMIAVLITSNAINTKNVRMMKLMGIQLSPSQLIPQNSHMMHSGEMMSDATMGDSSMSMDGMVESLQGKSGFEFDSEFVEQMIPHHQGAIDMANLALEHAESEELKQLAREIIIAQKKEIEMMLKWQDQWNHSN